MHHTLFNAQHHQSQHEQHKQALEYYNQYRFSVLLDENVVAKASAEASVIEIVVNATALLSLLTTAVAAVASTSRASGAAAATWAFAVGAVITSPSPSP